MKRKTYLILILSTSTLLLTPLVFNSFRSNNQIEDTTSNAILELTMNSFALRDSSLNVNHESINE
ncbi:hypothetical protein ACJA29_00130 [Metamycoplasma sualvi]|uniref:hypothetical protein n=1 Tax=Metamycoplasma sualvi TaxID=2125 RepID=UPI003873887A